MIPAGVHHHLAGATQHMFQLHQGCDGRGSVGPKRVGELRSVAAVIYADSRFILFQTFSACMRRGQRAPIGCRAPCGGCVCRQGVCCCPCDELSLALLYDFSGDIERAGVSAPLWAVIHWRRHPDSQQSARDKARTPWRSAPSCHFFSRAGCFRNRGPWCQTVFFFFSGH